MILARVVGTVVATRKDPRLEGKKLLILKPVSPEGKDDSGYVIAVDTVGAGYRERVLAVSGSSARLAEGCQGHSRRYRHRRHRRRCAAGLAVFLGRVVGCVWATAKNPQMEGMRFLIVQPLTPELQHTGKRLVCADATGAGAGELIYWVRGREACFPFLPKEVAADATIVGIVDEVHLARPGVTPADAKN